LNAFESICMTISQLHSNRKAHNWVFYDIGDRWLQAHTHLFQGAVYDFGCGEMPFREWISQYVDSYTGVDWSDTQHELKADIVADLNRPLPINSETADTIISISAMEHLSEPRMMLNEAFRILKPGGVLILQVPFMWWVHEAPYDYFRYTRHGLEYLFNKSGFSDVKVYPQTGFWVMWVLKFNYQSIRLIRGPWLIRKIVSLLLRVIWGVDQHLALWLDKHWKGEEETAGYFVVARKP